MVDSRRYDTAEPYGATGASTAERLRREASDATTGVASEKSPTEGGAERVLTAARPDVGHDDARESARMPTLQAADPKVESRA